MMTSRAIMKDIRKQYELIVEVKELVEMMIEKFGLDCDKTKKWKAIEHKYKLEARRLNRLDDKNKAAEPEWKACGDSYDEGVYCMYELPGVMTEEEQEEYVAENWEHFYDPYGDGRDCTGAWFTTSLRCIPVPEANKTIVIHRKHCDI